MAEGSSKTKTVIKKGDVRSLYESFGDITYGINSVRSKEHVNYAPRTYKEVQDLVATKKWNEFQVQELPNVMKYRGLDTKGREKKEVMVGK